MQERHQNRKQYFDEQALTTRTFVIPYMEQVRPVTAQLRVLEVGCGEGGNMVPFVALGCETVGIDINAQQIAKAREFLSEQFPGTTCQLFDRNIYDMTPAEIGTFDIIFLRDVIEHIPQQEKFLVHLKSFLRPDGIVFFGFPPWCMPFGGHQQICRSGFLSKLPYFHLLPRSIYAATLRAFGEPKNAVEELLEIKDTGISIHRFKRIIRQSGYRFVRETHYLINPNYQVKFGLTPRRQWRPITHMPYLRDFVTTCHYSVVQLER